MSANHDIIVSNFVSNETVHYSVILIKGLVKNKPNATCQNFIININVNNTDYSFPATNSFKRLIELNPGQNVLTFAFCCVKTTFILRYLLQDIVYRVIPLYIICQGHDGRFQATDGANNSIENACQKINICTKLLQCIVAEKLHDEKQGRKTFQIGANCQVFYSNLHYRQAREMRQEELWSSLGREIYKSNLQQEETKFLGFLSCTKYCGEKYEDGFTHDDIIGITQAYVALGGGGLALFGTACFYTWPSSITHVIQHFEDSTPIDRNKLMDDSCYRGTYGTCFSTTLGSVLHELCHTFDLGHTEKGIMGRGFDDVYKVFIGTEEKQKLKILRHFENNIEFTEKLDSGKLSERVKKQEKKSVVKTERRVEEDNTFWTKSCLMLLAYHRWLNNFEKCSKNPIKFDRSTRLASSTKGLRVIEIRRQHDEMVLQSWIFEGKILKYSFQIPKLQDAFPAILFIEDNVGNILKNQL